MSDKKPAKLKAGVAGQASRRKHLHELLAISTAQLDVGDFAEVTVESLMRDGDARRAREVTQGT